MVNIGFICEGDTETIIVNSLAFKNLLENHCLNIILPIINVQGKGKFHDKTYFNGLRNVLLSSGAEKIIVLTDLDDDKCIVDIKNKFEHHDNQIVIVAVKKIEAWFLADHETLSNCLKEKIYFEFPEEESNPFDKIRLHRGSGINSKPRFAQKMIQVGFKIENAAKHPNCKSAQYFIKKLESI